LRRQGRDAGGEDQGRGAVGTGRNAEKVKEMKIKRNSLAITLFFSALVLAGCIGPKTPLGRAVDSDDMQEVQNLFARGSDPCEKTGEYTAFDWAQGDNRELLKSDAIKTELYRVLLDKAYERYSNGNPCVNLVFYAARLGDAEMIRQLIAKGTDPDIGQAFWETSPLGIAAYYGNSDAVRALVDGGAILDLQIENLDKTRIWAMTIGRQSSYERADKALRMLRLYKEKQSGAKRDAQ